MKRILAILLCTAALFTTSCTTSSTAKQKLTSDECLIVIRSGTDKVDNGARVGRTYGIYVTGIKQRFTVPPVADRYIYFKITNDQAKIERLTSTMKAGWNGTPSSHDMDIKLPYEPGKVIPLSFSIINEINKNNANSYTSGVQLYELSEEEMNALYAEIKTDPEFESWF